MFTVTLGGKELGQFPNFPEAFACLAKAVIKEFQNSEHVLGNRCDMFINRRLEGCAIKWVEVTVVAGEHDAEKKINLDWFKSKELAMHIGIWDDIKGLKPVNVNV